MKKYLPYILAIVIVIGIFGVFGAHRAEAAGEGFLNKILGFNQLVANIGNFILIIVSKVVAIAGYFSDAAITYSIKNAGEGALTVVNEGWALSRDVANLFFIFILLYIAIATILQLSGYGMKELLVTVVVIALLVNFSLVITKVIIDGSNILAIGFYDRLTNIEYKNGGKVPGGSISQALVAGLDMQTLFSIKTSENNEDPLKTQKGEDATLLQIGIITTLGAGLFLVLAFVLFAAGVLFVIRTAILWILMILAPLAFLFMALPATKGYASQWWKKLFEQSFFAPAYLFLFYFVVKIVASGAILSGLKADNETFGSAFGSPDDANVKLILNFAIMIVLAIASLVVAKQMGAVGASTMQSWGQSAKKWGQAKAGRISRKGAGWAAEKAMDKESKINQWTGGRMAAFSKLPIIGRGFAKVSSLREKENIKQKKEWEKQYGGYSEAGLNAMLRSPMSGARKEAIQGALNKKINERENKEWYGKNEKRNFDKEIEGHKEELAGVEASISSSSYVDEKQKFEAQKKIITEKIKEAERDKERMDGIKREKNLEKILDEKIKKIKESESPAKPAPASTPKT